jgi:hypothetical protein
MELKNTRKKSKKAAHLARCESVGNFGRNPEIAPGASGENNAYLAAQCGNRPDVRLHRPLPPEMEKCIYEGVTITVLTFLVWGIPDFDLCNSGRLWGAFLDQYPSTEYEEVLSVCQNLTLDCTTVINIELTEAGAAAFTAQASHWIWPMGSSPHPDLVSSARLHKRRTQVGATPTGTECCGMRCNTFPLEPLSVETVCSDLPLAEHAPAHEFHSELTVHGASLSTATVCTIPSETAAGALSPLATACAISSAGPGHASPPGASAHAMPVVGTEGGYLLAATAQRGSSEGNGEGVRAREAGGGRVETGGGGGGGVQGRLVRVGRKWVLPMAGTLYCAIWLLYSGTPYCYLWLPFAILSSELTKVRMGAGGASPPAVVGSGDNRPKGLG